MEEIYGKSWEEFEEKVSSIFQDRAIKQYTPTYISPGLFRGQESAKWKLETTLERFQKRNFKMCDYYGIIRAVNPAVASLTEKSWKLTETDNTDEKGKSITPPLGYEFMVYLRHHGFPSPY